MTKSLKIAVATTLCCAGAAQARDAAPEWRDWVMSDWNHTMEVYLKPSSFRVEVPEKEPYITALGKFVFLSTKKVLFYKIVMPGSVCDTGAGWFRLEDLATGATDRHTAVLGGGNLDSGVAEDMCEFFNRNREGDSL